MATGGEGRIVINRPYDDGWITNRYVKAVTEKDRARSSLEEAKATAKRIVDDAQSRFDSACEEVEYAKAELAAARTPQETP